MVNSQNSYPMTVRPSIVRLQFVTFACLDAGLVIDPDILQVISDSPSSMTDRVADAFAHDISLSIEAADMRAFATAFYKQREDQPVGVIWK